MLNEELLQMINCDFLVRREIDGPLRGVDQRQFYMVFVAGLFDNLHSVSFPAAVPLGEKEDLKKVHSTFNVEIRQCLIHEMRAPRGIRPR